MRARFVLAATLAALVPSAAVAQTATDHMAGAIYATTRAALESAGIPVNSTVGQATLAGVSNGIAQLATLGGGGATILTWAAVLKAALSSGSSVGLGGGASGGGGASWGWDPCDFDWKMDADGNLIIPAMVLPPGGPMTLNSVGGRYFKVADYTANILYQGDSREAAALWHAHKFNGRAGNDEKYWAGLYKIVQTSTDTRTYYFSRPAQWFNGSKINYESRNAVTEPSSMYYSGSGTNQPCPQAVQSSDFHFYLANEGGTMPNTFSSCTFYAPNFSISPTGYFYPRVAAWPAGEIKDFPKNAHPDLQACRLDPALIAKITKAAWDKGAAAPGYEGAASPGLPVPKTDGVDPQVKDLANSPSVAPTGTPSDPTPSPSPTSGNDNGPPGTETPKPDTDLAAPNFGWWPEPPSLTINTSNDCPSYGFDAFGEHYDMTTHCTFAEQYRALIGAIMIVLFTIAAGRIVLDA